jgi:hypothetical protein
VLWHILCLPVAQTFCAVLWHILCRTVAHFVPSCSTFCTVLWHICLKVFLSCGTWYSVPSCQELQVKNCKSRIAKKVFWTVWTFFSRGLVNERIFSLVWKYFYYQCSLREVVFNVQLHDANSACYDTRFTRVSLSKHTKVKQCFFEGNH